MSFDPENYTYADKPDGWYEEWPGRIVGHVSLLRDLVDTSWADDGGAEGPAERLVHRMFFDLGYWVPDEKGNKLYVAGHNSAEAVVLGLDEPDPEDPKVVLGDYKEFYGQAGEPVAEDAGIIVMKRLSEIGFIFAASAQPERWQFGLGTVDPDI